MAKLDISHFPLEAVGSEVRDQSGIVILTATTSDMAHDVCVRLNRALGETLVAPLMDPIDQEILERCLTRR